MFYPFFTSQIHMFYPQYTLQMQEHLRLHLSNLISSHRKSFFEKITQKNHSMQCIHHPIAATPTYYIHLGPNQWTLEADSIHQSNWYLIVTSFSPQPCREENALDESVHKRNHFTRIKKSGFYNHHALDWCEQEINSECN